VPVPYQLPRLLLGSGKTHPLYHAIEPSLKELQQVIAGDAFHAFCLLEISAELPFENSVHTPDFLFLPEL
jgi:hypothetical protein